MDGPTSHWLLVGGRKGAGGNLLVDSPLLAALSSLAERAVEGVAQRLSFGQWVVQ